ncbi:MAG TPA: helix-turn-helix transcriptional regulator [Candidatus Limnocylindria bacterium]|nr:helix-turn-helix transcriptional regulator [Candidatus Limnocylindria bacterium]
MTAAVRQTVDEPPRGLAAVLREARRAIPAESASLGHVLRHPSRVGKAVSQEEIAEAVGVSRVWYAMLETGRASRPSVTLLERIANALMLDHEQRLRAFQLGVPEIAPRTFEQRHQAILEASARVRRSTKRLWTASSVEEAFAIAAEEATTHFGDAALVFYVHRVAPGRWDHPFVVDRGMGPQNEHLYEELAAAVGRERFDEVVLYPALSEPGDVGTRDAFAATSVGAAYEDAVARHKLQRWALLHARIRSRSGVTGGITVKHASERDYSEMDRAVISAIASVASLAIS